MFMATCTAEINGLLIVASESVFVCIREFDAQISKLGGSGVLFPMRSLDVSVYLIKPHYSPGVDCNRI